MKDRLINELVKELSERLVRIRNNLIVEAVNHLIGEDWEWSDMFDRGAFIKYPDGHETFMFDGTPLLEFHGYTAEKKDNPLQSEVEGKFLFKKLY